jgi:hypothetical protein
MRAVEVAQQTCRREPPADDVDAKRAAAGTYGGGRPFLGLEELRACWPLGLAFVRPGVAGLLLIIAVEFGLITCMGVFNPVYATYRLDQTATDRVTRTLSAWSVTGKATIAAMTPCGDCWPASPAPAPRSRSPVSSSWRPRSCSRDTTGRHGTSPNRPGSRHDGPRT